MQKKVYQKYHLPDSITQKVLPLVGTYYTCLKNIDQIINRNLYPLCVNQEVNKVFIPKLMVSFRCATKLSTYLVRANFILQKKKVGSFKCKGKRCQTCFNVNKMDSFASSATEDERKINHCFNCNKKCLIYLLACRVCIKQIVGKFTLRWYNYKSNNRKHRRLDEEVHHGCF